MTPRTDHQLQKPRAPKSNVAPPPMGQKTFGSSAEPARESSNIVAKGQQAYYVDNDLRVVVVSHSK